jgi:ankyrin repeat protein
MPLYQQSIESATAWFVRRFGGHETMSPLHACAQIQNVPMGLLAIVASALLKLGMDAEAVDASGRTALIVAAVHGCVAVVEALLAGGADTKAVGNDGRTAIFLAAFAGDVAVVDALCGRGGH